MRKFQILNFKFQISKGGFTLIEALAVIALIIIIFIPAYGLYNFGQKSYRDVSDKQEILQNGRVVLDRFSREIRQASEIVTELPEQDVDPVHEIEFQDGHLIQIQEDGTAQGGTTNSITLDSTASTEDDYYNEMFIKIRGGTGAGQIRKIIDYQGEARAVLIQDIWETTPESGSNYRVGSRYYYLRYFRDGNDFKRQIKIYYCGSDEDTHIPWNASCGEEQLNEKVLEDELIGEYVTGVNFWGSTLINVRIFLAKNDKTLELSTQLLGRNIQ
jgi:type II secretory pathway pseudopilin PulG